VDSWKAAGVHSSGQLHNTVDWPPKYCGAWESDLFDEAARCEPARTALMLVKRDLGVDVAQQAVGRLSLRSIDRRTGTAGIEDADARREGAASAR